VNVGIVTDFYFPWVAGPAIAVRSLAHGLAERGHRVALLVPSSTGPPEEHWEGSVRVTRGRTVAAPFGYGVRASLPLSVNRWLSDTKPDVVHIHHPFPLSAATLFAARGRGIPVVATNHTIPACTLWGLRDLGPIYSISHLAFARWIVALLNQADAVTTPSETARDALVGLGFRKHVHVVSNGIDLDRFSPGEVSHSLRKNLGLDERPVILYTGRLDAEKQMDVWVRAAAEIAARVDVQFLIGGKGTEREALERQVENAGLGVRTRFVGYLDDAKFPDLYRLADIYMITSPVELQSISTLEAVASDLPVVAANASALPELVHDGENGLLFSPGSAHEAARAAISLLSSLERRRVMGARSREVAGAHDVRRSIERYESILRSAAERGQGDRRIERAAAPGD
jgi:1,2-diacylglycerol 3-alpha-glucosyltransferase